MVFVFLSFLYLVAIYEMNYIDSERCASNESLGGYEESGGGYSSEIEDINRRR